MHNSDPTPQGVEYRNILLWFKCVLTALCVILVIILDLLISVFTTNDNVVGIDCVVLGSVVQLILIA
jgi:hypothetical protein